jgi:hypothetical protein
VLWDRHQEPLAPLLTGRQVTPRLRGARRRLALGKASSSPRARAAAPACAPGPPTPASDPVEEIEHDEQDIR